MHQYPTSSQIAAAEIAELRQKYLQLKQQFTDSLGLTEHKDIAEFIAGNINRGGVHDFTLFIDRVSTYPIDYADLIVKLVKYLLPEHEEMASFVYYVMSSLNAQRHFNPNPQLDPFFEALTDKGFYELSRPKTPTNPRNVH